MGTLIRSRLQKDRVYFIEKYTVDFYKKFVILLDDSFKEKLIFFVVRFTTLSVIALQLGGWLMDDKL